MSETINKKVILHYSADTASEPIVYLLVKEYELIPNIIKAAINPDQEGQMLLGLTGTEANYQKAMSKLQELGIGVKFLADKVSWDEDTCTQCGACTAVCPSKALSLTRPEMTVMFCSDKCVVCHMCIDACPVGAVTMDF